MLKLNRTTEYGLMALRHMSRQGAERASAREIADLFGLPFEITAKTLQRLKDAGLILSVQGAHGGYTLSRPLEEVTLASFLQLMEGPQFLVSCATEGKRRVAIPRVRDAGGCEYHSRCEIKLMMSELNGRIFGFFSGIRLADLIRAGDPCDQHRQTATRLVESAETEG
jgi:Rrf2 family protein